MVGDIMQRVTWNQIKSLHEQTHCPLLNIQEDDEFVYPFIVIESKEFNCVIDKSTDDYDDYLQHIVNSGFKYDKEGRNIVTSSPFSNALNFRFRGASFKGEVPANSTQDIDYKLEQTRYINGGRAIIDNIGDDDRVTFQVVDKDNILGLGVGAVLDEFISEFYVPQDGSLEVLLPYPAKIHAGLYLRLKYSSTHTDGCTLKCNLYLHMKSV